MPPANRRVRRVALLLGVLVLVGATAASAQVYDLQWGSAGSGNGQFTTLRHVATDPAGNVFVADYGNNRIQKFSSTGAYLLQWGGAGSGNGQLSGPFGLATDAAGNVYVAERFNNRVQVFSGTGAYLRQWGGFGSGNGQFDFPNRLTVDAAGNVYVVENAGGRVQKFTSTGTYLTQWPVSLPTGIATDAAGHVFVTQQSANRVNKYDAAGTLLAQWGTPGTGDGQFNIPEDVATDAHGNVYVVDWGNNRIQEFTNAGAFVTRWGSAGAGNGQFNQPYGLCLDAASDVYVADAANNRIQKFDPACTAAITLSTQAQVDAFACTGTQGSLTIRGAGITNLDALSSLTFVAGNLVIDTNPLLTNVNGLAHVQSVAGRLDVTNNAALTNLDGLAGLNVVTSHVTLTSNPQLAACCALYRLLQYGVVGGLTTVNNNSPGCNAAADITPACLDSTRVPIALDGEFADWSAVSPTSDPAGDAGASGIDFRRLDTTTERDWLYLHFDTSIEVDPDLAQNITLAFDTDDDPATGKPLAGLGAELVWNLGQRRGSTTIAGVTQPVTDDAIGLVVAPTVSGSEFELRVRRDAVSQSLAPIFMGTTFRVALLDSAAGGDQVVAPRHLRFSQVPTPVPSISMTRLASTDVRVATFNTELDGLFDNTTPGRATAFQRMIQSIDADVWILNEVFGHTAANVRTLFDQILPPTGGGAWYACGGLPNEGVVIVTRFRILETDDVTLFPRDYIVARVDARPRLQTDLVVIGNHWKAFSGASNDALRQDAADRLTQYLAALRAGRAMNVARGTPIVFGGDLNLVGARRPLTTLLTGDIVNPAYGPDSPPDWDGSAFDVVMGRHPDANVVYTWRNDADQFSPGKLDWLVYTGSALQLRKSLVLETRDMTAASLAAANVQAGDTPLASDHAPQVADFIGTLPPVAGNVTVSSQAAVNAFTAAWLPGNLVVSGSDVANLNGLASLVRVDGDVVIANCPQLRDATGLAHLRTIGGSLSVHDDPGLLDLAGLASLDSVGANVIVQDNPNLAICCGVGPLLTSGHVGGTVTVDRNRAGCGSLTEIVTGWNAASQWASSVVAFSSQYSASTWSAQQALGPPDVFPAYGDLPNAWASLTPDGQAEYLDLAFAAPQPVDYVRVVETNGPGALTAVSVKNPNTGLFQLVWSGLAKPAPAASRILVVRFPPPAFPVSEVRLDFDSPGVPDWNEIDAVAIGSCDTRATIVGTPPGAGVPVANRIEWTRPNPFARSVSLAFTLAREGPACVEVFDVTGQRVQRVLDRTLPAGRHEVSWDGRDAGGHRAPSGVYYLRVTGAELREMRRIVKLQ